MNIVFSIASTLVTCALIYLVFFLTPKFKYKGNILKTLTVIVISVTTYYSVVTYGYRVDVDRAVIPIPDRKEVIIYSENLVEELDKPIDMFKKKLSDEIVK